MIVVDASVVVDILLRSPDAPALERRVFGQGHALCAPHLIDLEVAQAFRRLHLGGHLDDVRAGQALKDFSGLPLVRYPHLPFLSAIWRYRNNLTAYDAAYVALARTLGAVLLTRDARLADAPNLGARVDRV